MARISSGAFATRFYSMVNDLADRVDELSIVQSERHRADNVLPAHLLGANITGQVDTFPICVRRSKDYATQRMYYTKKIHGHCVKIQLVVNNKSQPMWFSGPHLGSCADNSLWRGYCPSFLYKPESRGERLLGDKAYIGERKIVASFKRPAYGDVTDGQYLYNLTHARIRIRVEHAIAYIKRFKILNEYRGRITEDSHLLLQNVVKVIIHLTAMQAGKYQLRSVNRIVENAFPPNRRARGENQTPGDQADESD